MTVTVTDPQEILLTDPFLRYVAGTMDHVGEFMVQITNQGEQLTQNKIKQILGASVLKLVIKVLGGKLTIKSGSQHTTYQVMFPCKL